MEGVDHIVVENYSGDCPTDSITYKNEARFLHKLFAKNHAHGQRK
jgi:hypothetical protein